MEDINYDLPELSFVPCKMSSLHLETEKPASGVLLDLQKASVSHSQRCNRIPLPPRIMKMSILVDFSP